MTLLDAASGLAVLPSAPSCWYDPDHCPASMPWKERQMNGCFTFEMCCIFDGYLGERCWDTASVFTFERCCALAADSDNQRHIPYWHSKQVLIKLQDDFATFKEGGQTLRLHQDVPGTFEGEWQIYEPQRVPLVLWESGYLMMRWMENKAIAAGGLRDQRVLELGAGIGLAAITAALGGAHVLATDGSGDAVQLMKRNIQANLDREQATRIRPIRLDWTTIIVQGADMEPGPKKEAAMRRLMEAGVSGPFDIVVCAALGYVQIQVFHALLGILDLVTNKETIVFWGAGKDSTINLNKSWNRDEMSVEMDKAFMILSEAGSNRPAHLNLYELRRRATWEGAPVFRIQNARSLASEAGNAVPQIAYRRCMWLHKFFIVGPSVRIHKSQGSGEVTC
ncbi:METTL21A [Symbiodinium natans]|uniref:METTL21A protein n=1 Tax=Symbiodinium natans TaxID=878477 RepID=A0A812KJA8_9DINO|nr:METTL21A [Symbiodinium natans]